MTHKTQQITIDIPADTYQKIQDITKQYTMNVEEAIIELIQHGLLTYPECPLDHILLRPLGYGGHAPNAETKKAIADTRTRKNLHRADNVNDLFKKLRA